ncbi:Scr1 family TA system antitoxin-like transcriptional regulator [Streptomyces cyslabdanicus]|uniref:Scr1 family TA system antitoxin-like transcriptional regulator n=1 Tax=Streptomyces cyslabdanicus TaxID=1470456 RepID=UPI0040445136
MRVRCRGGVQFGGGGEAGRAQHRPRGTPRAAAHPYRLGHPGILRAPRRAVAEAGLPRRRDQRRSRPASPTRAAVSARSRVDFGRQDIFDRQPAPLPGFVLDESVLRHRDGGRRLLRGELEPLLLIGQKPNVEIQGHRRARSSRWRVRTGPRSRRALSEG